MVEHADHRFRPAVPEDDGCLYSVHRCGCGALYVKKKRRPAHITDTECTWLINCADHPKMDQHLHAYATRAVAHVLEMMPAKESIAVSSKRFALRTIARQLMIQSNNLRN